MRREKEQVVFASEATFVGRHVHGGIEYQGERTTAPLRGVNYGERPTWLSLQDAAAHARVPVEGLKRAIREGELRAERRGWVRIHRGDLDDWLHRV
jgi:excisionase family DNA binding protein